MARSVMSSMLPTGVGTMYNIPITAAKVRKNQIKAKELGFIYYLYTIIDGLCTIIDGKNHPFALSPKSPISNSTLQRPHGVQDSHDGDTHIGKDCEPHGSQSDNSQ